MVISKFAKKGSALRLAHTEADPHSFHHISIVTKPPAELRDTLPSLTRQMKSKWRALEVGKWLMIARNVVSFESSN